MKLLKLCLAVVLLLLAFYFRTPLLASLRVWVLGFILVSSVGLMSSEILILRNNSILRKSLVIFLILTLTSFSLSAAVAFELKFNLTKHTILNQTPNQLETLGQHFIIGYRNLDEVKKLIRKRAIGGVFITRRNINNKTKEQIKQEIQSLQNLRYSQGLSPLWIATDQEGGIVSRMSPPLTQLPQLSTLVAGEERIEQKRDEIIQYATIHGKELSEMGVNLNFAPVVDLNKGIINPKDKYSKIYLRSISADKNIVTKVALWYCQTLEKYGVECTIKHFPGLGRVDTDTHLDHAELKSSVEELSQDDWIPFRELMSKSGAFTMLGHAKLTAVDADHPVSFSKQVVTEIIRNDWQHDGILITDDFSMQAVYGTKDGIENATVKAINAGVDLILISYDTDLYYEAMAAVLNAQKLDKLDPSMLSKSQKRLDQTKNRLMISH